MRNVKYKWFAEENVASHGFDGALGGLLVVEDDEGLASHLDVALSVHFYHFPIVAKQLIQSILEVRYLDSFIKILHIDSRIGLIQYLFHDFLYHWLLRCLLLERWSHGSRSIAAHHHLGRRHVALRGRGLPELWVLLLHGRRLVLSWGSFVLHFKLL